jgi:hypothetical protein
MRGAAHCLDPDGFRIRGERPQGVLLAWEVPVEGALGDPRGRGEVTDRDRARPGVHHRGDDAQRRVQNA